LASFLNNLTSFLNRLLLSSLGLFNAGLCIFMGAQILGDFRPTPCKNRIADNAENQNYDEITQFFTHWIFLLIQRDTTDSEYDTSKTNQPDETDQQKQASHCERVIFLNLYVASAVGYVADLSAVCRNWFAEQYDYHAGRYQHRPNYARCSRAATNCRQIFVIPQIKA